MSFLTITDQQRRALKESAGAPVQVFDHVMLRKYVIMDEALYATAVKVLREHDPYTAELLDETVDRSRGTINARRFP